MEITLSELEEALDKRFAKVATKEDLKEALVPYATKEDLKAFATKEDLKDFVTQEFLKTALEKQTKELKDYTDEQTDTLAAYIAETIALPLEELKRDFKQSLPAFAKASADVGRFSGLAK